jgi:hypothetical protein
MLRNFKLLLMMVAAITMISACHSKKSADNDSQAGIPVQDGAEISYLPFQTKANGKWGLIGVDGRVLFADSLSHEPSAAVNGIFTVKNSRGLYEYYTATASPKKIGGEYTKAGLFWEDVAPCKESDKDSMQLINKDGTVVCKLNPDITWVGKFSCGLAPFKQGNRYGYLNTQGKVVTEATLLHASDYSEGYALVVKADSDNVNLYGSKGNYRISIINEKGDVMKVSYHHADSIGSAFHEGLLRRNTRVNDSTMICGFMDVNGQMLIPGKHNYQRVSDMHFTHFAFYDGGEWGIADNQLSTILTARYDDVISITEEHVAVKEYGLYKLLNYSGEQISKSYTYMKAVNDGKCYIAERGGIYQLIDADGNIIGKSYYKITLPDTDDKD